MPASRTHRQQRKESGGAAGIEQKGDGRKAGEEKRKLAVTLWTQASREQYGYKE